MRAIYLKTIGADAHTRLTLGKAPEGRPSCSPDGRFIAFFRPLRPVPAFAVMLIPAEGGPENQIAEIAGPGSLSWSSDGEWLVAVDGPPRAKTIIAISVSTGAKRVLTEPFEFGYFGAALA